MTEMSWSDQKDVCGRQPSGDGESEVESAVMAYDVTLLERSITQWQFGDWKSLCELSEEVLLHHPHRAKLALLAAAGWLQSDGDDEGGRFIRLAIDWGVCGKTVSRVLIAGVYNSLARAEAVEGMQDRALQHFADAIEVGAQGGDTNLLARARYGEQLGQLGVLTPGVCVKDTPYDAAVADVLQGRDLKKGTAWFYAGSPGFIDGCGSDEQGAVNHIDSRIECLDYHISIMEEEKQFLIKQQKSKYYTEDGYDARRYWNDRHSMYGFNMQGVGNKGLSAEENQMVYRKAGAVFLALCKECNVDFSSSSVLDVGCGTGFYADLFRSSGVKRYLGVDISGVLLGELRERFSGYEFKEFDVTEEFIDGCFDMIVMIDVTQHIVSRSKFSFAMQNIKNSLSNSGVFVVTSWLNKEMKNSVYEVSRGMDVYLKEFNGWNFSKPVPFRDKFIFSIARGTR